jgi:hypothetical protein
MEDPEVMVVEDIAEEVALPHATVNGEGGVSPPSSPVTVQLSGRTPKRGAVSPQGLHTPSSLSPKSMLLWS